MSKTTEKLLELLDLKDVKIRGLEIAIDHLKTRENKALVNLGYLYKRLDNKSDRDLVNQAIEIVKAAYEQI